MLIKCEYDKKIVPFLYRITKGQISFPQFAPFCVYIDEISTEKHKRPRKKQSRLF